MTTNQNLNEQTPKNKYADILEYFDNSSHIIMNNYSYEQERTIDDTALKNTILKLIQKLSISEQISQEHAFIGICALLQSGAYLKSVSNRKIRISNNDFTKKTLIYIAEQIDCKYTLRVIAKYLNNKIALISYNYGLPGNLFAQFKIEYNTQLSTLTPEEIRNYAAYCTDFQIDNPNTPLLVREFLANREKNRKKSK